jgi:hypothetical protein
VSRKVDYGTAPHEEIIAGIETATKIGKLILEHKNPAVQNMIKQMIALIAIDPPKERP